MNRNKKFRRKQLMQNFMFFLTGVPGNVNLFKTFVHNVRAQPIQVVDHAVNHLFVAGNRRSRNNHGIVIAYRNLIGIPRSHSRQSAHRFSLRTRRQNYDFAVEQILVFRKVHKNPFGDFQLADFHGGVHHLQHASAGKRHFSAVLHRPVDNLLQSVHVGSERSHNQSSVAVFRKKMVQRGSHHGFAHRVAHTFDIRGFSEV